jgi:hypothetical protein
MYLLPSTTHITPPRTLPNPAHLNLSRPVVLSGPAALHLPSHYSGSLAITIISIFYAYLLQSIRRYDRALAFGLYTDTRSPSSVRREGSSTSILNGVGRSQSLIPPVPVGYQAVESGAAARMGV